MDEYTKGKIRLHPRRERSVVSSITCGLPTCGPSIRTAAFIILIRNQDVGKVQASGKASHFSEMERLRIPLQAESGNLTSASDDQSEVVSLLAVAELQCGGEHRIEN